jgi:hypothetical protein
MARLTAFVFLSLIGLTLRAQPPAPPALLPPSVANPRPATADVVPVALAAKPAAPIERYERDLRLYPAETAQAVYSVRAAGAWLVRMNQADGKFMAGLNPALARPTEGISDMAQAYAAWACAKLARFTGDDKTAATANQAVLALLTMTKVDGDQRVPVAASEKCNRVGFASLLALAICELPGADAKRIADAEMLGAFLKKQLRDNGSVNCTDTPDGDVRKSDPFGAQMYPGHCFQALMALDRVKPEQWKRDAVMKGMTYYREAFKAEPAPMTAGAMLPAAVELLQRGKVESVVAFAWEMADSLCGCQAVAADSPLRMVGGFRVYNADPAATTAWCGHGLAAAVQLALQVSDGARAGRYRTALVNALAFVRSLQFTDESCQHFEKNFRLRFLLGGMVVSTTDGNLRVDQTAMLALSQMRFLESGADRGQ